MRIYAAFSGDDTARGFPDPEGRAGRQFTGNENMVILKSAGAHLTAMKIAAIHMGIRMVQQVQQQPLEFREIVTPRAQVFIVQSAELIKIIIEAFFDGVFRAQFSLHEGIQNILLQFFTLDDHPVRIEDLGDVVIKRGAG